MLYDAGYGVTMSAACELAGQLSVRASGTICLVPSPAASDLGLVQGDLGLAWEWYPLDRLGVGVHGGGGPYIASFGDSSGWSWTAEAGGQVVYRLNPAVSAVLSAGYEYHLAPGEPLLRSLGFGLGARLSPGGLSGGDVSIMEAVTGQVFPVFHTHYDDHPFGSVTVANGENGTIRDVRVSFFAKQYMTEPKLCAVFASIPRGGTVKAPVLALFNEDILRLTEDTKASAEISVTYSFLGSARQVRHTQVVQVRHRNAMSWDDDRRAAAFVSPRDPAVLRYSKYTAGLVREADTLTELDQNLKFAVGLFEGLALYGLNYVVDPTTPYSELSEHSGAVDFLQYPYQTLVYKGGDCDDLSIMFAAVLESVGIPAAFVTVPGHIYLAFGLQGDEAAARRGFSSPDDLIFINGKAWVPLEITLVNGGFVKAWQYGAREWREHPEERALLPVAEAWSVYDPVGIPGEDTRIVLPPAEGIVAAWKASMGTFVDRELQALTGRLRGQLAAKPADGRLLNSLGILYARYGHLSEARAEFEKAVKAGYQPAVCNLGNVAFLQKDYQTAMSMFARSLEQRPDHAASRLGYARAAYEIGQGALAAEQFDKLKATSPEVAAAYAYLASAADGGRASSAVSTLPSLWDGE